MRALSDEHIARDMAQAVADDDIAKIHDCAARGADVNARDSVGLTLLQNAANEGRQAAAEALINLGADVNATGGPSHWTALHYAAYRNNRAMVEVLLRGQADPNIATPDAETALHTAAHAGDINVVVALIHGGADATAKDKRGHTAGKIAAIRAAERFQFAQQPFVEIADYLAGKVQEAELRVRRERQQREEVARDLSKLKALRPERCRLKPR